MNPIGKLIVTAFITLVTGIAGVLVTPQLIDIATGNWIRLNLPPDRIVDLVLADDKYYFPKSNKGETYSCSLNAQCKLIDPNDIKTEPTPKGFFGQEDPRSEILYVPLLPQWRIAAIWEYDVFVSTVTYASWRYILYEDGSMWRRYRPPATGDVADFRGSLLVFFVGGLGGLLACILLLWRKSNSPPAHDEKIYL